MSKGGKLSKAALEGWPPPTSSVSNTGLCAASHLGSDQLPLCRIMVLCRETERGRTHTVRSTRKHDAGACSRL